MKAPHALITENLLKEWGYITVGDFFANWNGVWVRKGGDIWEYGNPNHHTIDKEHPFIKQGEVKYLDELNKVNGKRGLEHKKYSNA